MIINVTIRYGNLYAKQYSTGLNKHFYDQAIAEKHFFFNSPTTSI